MFFVALILSIVKSKVREGLISRIGTIKKTKYFFDKIEKDKIVYWFHCASHGEYEQVNPILSSLKEIQKNCIIITSFSSPAGYNNVIDKNIDLKIYLPLDFLWNTIRIIKIIRPQKLIFAEYDLWPNYIWTAKWLDIHTTLFSARFYHKNTKLLPTIKNFYKYIYSSLSAIYTISEKDNLILKKFLTRNYKGILRVLGSPRYDRVSIFSINSNIKSDKEKLIRPYRLIAGSVWPEDDEIILNVLIEKALLIEDFFFTWAPHEINIKYINDIKRKIFKAGLDPVLFSTIGKNNKHFKCIILDKIGYLANHYWSGNFAYIGGGFSSGIHNVMEPAIASLPIVFGPKYHNSHTAEELLKYGGGFEINSSDEFENILSNLIRNDNFYLKSSQSSSEVIYKNIGSATRVVRGILSD
tara:strand:- start:2008 stop:3240 length:1233 start_codon:yes stop_codon:yes gene_type:complete